jgi:hypothetical protein
MISNAWKRWGTPLQQNAVDRSEATCLLKKLFDNSLAFKPIKERSGGQDHFMQHRLDWYKNRHHPAPGPGKIALVGLQNPDVRHCAERICAGLPTGADKFFKVIYKSVCVNVVQDEAFLARYGFRIKDGRLLFSMEAQLSDKKTSGGKVSSEAPPKRKRRPLSSASRRGRKVKVVEEFASRMVAAFVYGVPDCLCDPATGKYIKVTSHKKGCQGKPKTCTRCGHIIFQPKTADIKDMRDFRRDAHKNGDSVQRPSYVASSGLRGSIAKLARATATPRPGHKFVDDEAKVDKPGAPQPKAAYKSTDALTWSEENITNGYEGSSYLELLRHHYKRGYVSLAAVQNADTLLQAAGGATLFDTSSL